jgi:hypothetical protein
MWKARDFPQSSEETATRCNGDVLCADGFEITGARRGGGSGAYPVKVTGPSCTAWAKPTTDGGANARAAAHEKIVADLAFKLGFPVAPVMLSRLTKDKKFQGNPVSLPKVVALSFDVFRQPRPWNAIQPLLDDKHKAALCPQLSAALALHCWVDDHDHDWNDGNALFEIDADGGARAAFFDYAFSLSHEWTPPTDAPTRDWKRRNGPYALTETSQIVLAVERIEQLEVNELEVIITRIPADCLPTDLGRSFVTALDKRRKQLRKLLNLAGAP